MDTVGIAVLIIKQKKAKDYLGFAEKVFWRGSSQKSEVSPKGLAGASSQKSEVLKDISVGVSRGTPSDIRSQKSEEVIRII